MSRVLLHGHYVVKALQSSSSKPTKHGLLELHVLPNFDSEICVTISQDYAVTAGYTD